ncbi:MAG: branched-chain amino acid ABC transporter permease [Candidatus Bathyarchaeia archaeon]
MNEKQELWKSLLGFLALIAVLTGAPYLLNNIYYLNVLRDVIFWVALSVSWYLFSGLTKYVALGSAAFFGLGLYFTAKVLNYWPVLPFPVVVILAGLLNFTIALAVGLISLRLKGIYFAIVTFGIAEIVKVIFDWWEIRITGTLGTYLPIFSDITTYYSILTTSLTSLVLVTLLRRSKFGLALRMIGESEETAAHTGVNTSLYKTIGFAISAACIGLVGASCITISPYTNTRIAFGSRYSFYPAVMTLLGGAGTPYGPVIGASALSLINEYLSVAFPQVFQIILGALLIIIVLVMPNGIMGIVEKFKTLGSREGEKKKED